MMDCHGYNIYIIYIYIIYVGFGICVCGMCAKQICMNICPRGQSSRSKNKMSKWRIQMSSPEVYLVVSLVQDFG